MTSEWNVDAEPGQYMIRIKEPIEFQYEEEGTLKDFYNEGDMWTAFPIAVELSLILCQTGKERPR